MADHLPDLLAASTPRRGFVGRLLAGVAAVAGAPLVGRGLAAQGGPSAAPSPPSVRPSSRRRATGT